MGASCLAGLNDWLCGLLHTTASPKMGFKLYLDKVSTPQGMSRWRKPRLSPPGTDRSSCFIYFHSLTPGCKFHKNRDCLSLSPLHNQCWVQYQMLSKYLSQKEINVLISRQSQTHPMR